MSLAHAPIRKTLRILGVRRGGLLTQRLMEMGLIEGAEVEVIRRAPLGDPLHVRLGDSELSLRTSEARLVDVSSV